MKSICLRVQRIIDFGALVSVVGVDNDTAAPVTVHVDYQASTPFWRAWCAADCAQPIEYAADRLLLQLDMVPNEDIDDAPEIECDDLAGGGRQRELVFGAGDRAMSDGSPSKSARIRELNDQLRRDHVGGRIVITSGIQALGPDGVREVLTAVAQFNDFTDENDPYGEHDCAVLTVGCRRIIFKHDYYDRQLSYHSPDASDPAVTTRVLTIMLSDEY